VYDGLAGSPISGHEDQLRDLPGVPTCIYLWNFLAENFLAENFLAENFPEENSLRLIF